MEPGMKLECWQFYRLAVMMTDSKFYNWMLERFNNLYMYTDFSCSYYNWDEPYFFELYNEVIDYYDLNSNGDVVKSIISEIDKGRYVLALCDRYYIKGTQEYQKAHSRHEMLIIGYSKEEFDFVDININGTIWSLNKIKYSTFEESFSQSMLQIINDIKNNLWVFQYNLPVVAFKSKTDSFNRKYRLEVFWNCIIQNIEGKVFGEKLYRAKENRMPNVYRTGIAIYEGYYKDLAAAINSPDIKLNVKQIMFGANKLLELKTNFKTKLEYIMNDRNRFNQDIIDNAQKLVDVIKLALDLLMKYFITKNKKHFEHSMEYLKQAEGMDYELLQMSSEFIEELIADNFRKK